MNVIDPKAVFSLAEEPSSTDWPLMFPANPRPGESFPGLVCRAAAENVSPSVATLLRIAKVRPRLRFLLKGLTGPEARSLARFLGTSESAVVERIHPAVQSDPSGCTQLSYFGAAMRADLFEMRVRRIAPAALENESYHRVAWQLRLLAFDPGTMTFLIGRCPYCLRDLGCHNPFGIHVCEHCERDLRGVDTGSVGSNVRDECRWMAQLLDHDANVRARARALLPSPLRNWEEGQLVDLAIRLAPLLEDEQAQRQDKSGKFTSRFSAGGWSTERLASMVRLLLEWPKSFFRICDTRRSNRQARDGFYGEEKELADVSILSSRSEQPERVRALLRDGISAYCDGLDTVMLRGLGRTDGAKIGMEQITRVSKEIGQTLKVMGRVLHLPELRTFRDPAAKRSPILVDRNQILAWNAVRLSLIDSFQIGQRTGIPEYALVDLVRAKIIEAGSGPGVVMAGPGTWFTKASIESLVTKLSSCPLVAGATDHSTLAQYMADHVRVPKPWTAVIEALLENPRLVVGRLNGARLATGLVVDRKGLDAVVSIRELAAAFPPEVSATMTNLSAAAYLDTTGPMITHLCNAKLINTVRVGVIKRPLRTSVEKFAKDYILGNELLRRLGLPKFRYSAFLLERKIEPAATVGGHHLVWNRNEIEQLITL